MKSLIHAAVAASLVPAMTFAQQSSGVTRAQVRAELIELEQAGYQPGALMIPITRPIFGLPSVSFSNGMRRSRNGTGGHRGGEGGNGGCNG